MDKSKSCRTECLEKLFENGFPFDETVLEWLKAKGVEVKIVRCELDFTGETIPVYRVRYMMGKHEYVDGNDYDTYEEAVDGAVKFVFDDLLKKKSRKEQIEEAANQFDIQIISNPWILFKRGAEWADENPKNVWHRSEHEQPDGKRIVIAYDGNIASAEKYVKVNKAHMWCYLDDILPKTETF